MRYFVWKSSNNFVYYMNKLKYFFIAVGSFFRWMWEYPTTPIENFQDAISQYRISTDKEIQKLLKDLENE